MSALVSAPVTLGYLPFTHSEGWADLRSDGVQQAPVGTHGNANLSPLPSFHENKRGGLGFQKEKN